MLIYVHSIMYDVLAACIHSRIIEIQLRSNKHIAISDSGFARAEWLQSLEVWKRLWAKKYLANDIHTTNKISSSCIMTDNYWYHTFSDLQNLKNIGDSSDIGVVNLYWWQSKWNVCIIWTHQEISSSTVHILATTCMHQIIHSSLIFCNSFLIKRKYISTP